MERPSKPVNSVQRDVHPELAIRVRRHRNHPWQRPVAAHTAQAFADCADRVEAHSGPVILDSGCGTGSSALALATASPDALVVGVDKSAARLGRGLPRPLPDNLLLLRADLVDFWRLARKKQWRPVLHRILYPNPWPKPSQLGRRWHAHPVFPTLLALGGQLEMRTNWEVYAREWAQALAIHGHRPAISRVDDETGPASPFERKYLGSGHVCWRCLSAAGPVSRSGMAVATTESPV